jgi:acyl carrier protein
LEDGTSLITGGFVDSTGLLEVIAFLEAEYDIRVLDQETIPENLETIGRIAAFVARKRAAGG